MQTLWKDIIGFENSYQISNSGKIRSLDRIVSNRGGFRKIYGKELKNCKDLSGYLIVSLKKNSKCYTKTVHRLVAIHFIPNPLNLPEVNHKDGDKSNPNDWNLEWSTKSENSIHAYKLKLKKSNFKPTKEGIENPNSKLNIIIVADIREKYATGNYTQRNLANLYNITQVTVWQIVNKKTWI